MEPSSISSFALALAQSGSTLLAWVVAVLTPETQVWKWGVFGLFAAFGMAMVDIERDRKRGIKPEWGPLMWMVVPKCAMGFCFAVGSGLLCVAVSPESSPATWSAAAWVGGMMGKEIPVYAKAILDAWVRAKAEAQEDRSEKGGRND